MNIWAKSMPAAPWRSVAAMLNNASADPTLGLLIIGLVDLASAARMLLLRFFSISPRIFSSLYLPTKARALSFCSVRI